MLHHKHSTSLNIVAEIIALAYKIKICQLYICIWHTNKHFKMYITHTCMYICIYAFMEDMTSFENSSNTFSYFLTDSVRLDMCVCARIYICMREGNSMCFWQIPFVSQHLNVKTLNSREVLNCL